MRRLNHHIERLEHQRLEVVLGFRDYLESRERRRRLEKLEVEIGKLEERLRTALGGASEGGS